MNGFWDDAGAHESNTSEVVSVASVALGNPAVWPRLGPDG